MSMMNEADRIDELERRVHRLEGEISSKPETDLKECPSCRKFLDDAKKMARALQDKIEILLLTAKAAEDYRALANRLESDLKAMRESHTVLSPCQVSQLYDALLPFAKMDRPGELPDHDIACQRGVGMDYTMIDSKDFRRAKEALKSL